jgi:hypothetical protein
MKGLHRGHPISGGLFLLEPRTAFYIKKSAYEMGTSKSSLSSEQMSSGIEALFCAKITFSCSL